MFENIYQRDHTQIPPVFELIKTNETDAVISMLEDDPTLVTLKGWMDDTPLHISAYYGNFKLVKYLVEHGADINARRTDNGTALYWTSTGEIAEYLIEHGANLDHDNYCNPLNWAVRYARPDVMEVLIKHGMNINGSDKYPILEVRDITCLSVFVKYKANLNLSDDYGRSILHCIAWYDNASLLDYALSVGVEWTRNNGGETPYHVAKRGKRQNIIEFLETKYPALTTNNDQEVNIANNEIYNIQKFIFIHSSNSIISIGKNAHLSLWQIKDGEVILSKTIQLNRSNIPSIAYKEDEAFFIIPSEDDGTLELRDIHSLALISEKKLPISARITAVAYSRDMNFLLLSESWSPIYKVDLDFNISTSKEIDYGIFDFSFDKNSQLVGVDCYDQNEFVELYRLKTDGSFLFLMDFFKESESFSSPLYFNPFKKEFAISYSKELFYYSYEDSAIPQVLWKKEITNSTKPNLCGFVDYIDSNRLIWGYKDTIQIIDCSSHKELKSYKVKGKIVRRILFIKNADIILISTELGFIILNIEPDLTNNHKSWWNFWS